MSSTTGSVGPVGIASGSTATEGWAAIYDSSTLGGDTNKWVEGDIELGARSGRIGGHEADQFRVRTGEAPGLFSELLYLPTAVGQAQGDGGSGDQQGQGLPPEDLPASSPASPSHGAGS